MRIHWKNERTRKMLEDFDLLKSKYDEKVAANVAKRLREIEAFPSFADLPPNTGKHSIKKGKKFICLAVDLPLIGGGRGKWRLIFLPYGDYDPANHKTIIAVEILGIADYHN